MAGAGVLLGWAGWVVYKAFSGDVELADQWSGTGAFALAVLLALPQLRSSPQPARVDQSDRAANDLAQAVWKRSREEERRQKVHDPVPLPVRWHNAPGDLVDQWENIREAPAGVRSEPLCLDNTVDDIAETFRSVPSRRLVVLGKAGSGKTVLAHHLIHQLLDQRESTDPVPVLFSLNTWDVTTPLRDWLVAQLRRDYDLDGTDSTGTTLAQALVDNDRILPILDGFDEITAERRTTEENHRTALSALNDTDLPMVLTSRPNEYRDAVAGDLFLAKAAAIELEDLTLDDLANYLTRTTRKTPNGDGDTPWDPVLRHLRDQPHDPASAQLRHVLTTPLMVFLARTIYSAPARRDPAELLNTAVFRSTQHLENYLLDAFIPAVYGENTDTKRQTPRWRSGQAQRWLGYLADHLTRLNTHDLAWWQLATAFRWYTRLLITVITIGIAVGLTFGLEYGLTYWVRPGLAYWVMYALRPRLTNWLMSGFSRGLALGIVAGIVAGVINEVRFRRRRTAREPERLRLHLKSVTDTGRVSNIRRLATRFTAGLAFGLVVGLAALFEDGLASMFTTGLATGLAVGIPAGALNVVIAMLGDSHSPQDSVAPWKFLSTDRTVTLIRTITFGLAIGAPFGLLIGTEGGLTEGLAAGVTVGLTFALARLMLSAWGNWLLFARLWLPLTRRLPWRPKRFLEDAYRRGVLRQAGAVYQFRHAQLQDHLTAQYRNQPRTTPPEEAPEREDLNPVPEPR